MLFKILLVFHAFIALLLILVVIIQPGQSEGGVLGGPGTSSAFGADTVSVLTKTTAIIGAIFLASSLALSLVGSKYFSGKSSVIVKEVKK